jgi:hypothetical protein
MNAAVGSQGGAFNVVSAASGAIGRLHCDGLSVGGHDVQNGLETLLARVTALENLLAGLSTFPDGALLSWSSTTGTLTPVQADLAEAEPLEGDAEEGDPAATAV